MSLRENKSNTIAKYAQGSRLSIGHVTAPNLIGRGYVRFSVQVIRYLNMLLFCLLISVFKRLNADEVTGFHPFTARQPTESYPARGHIGYRSCSSGVTVFMRYYFHHHPIQIFRVNRFWAFQSIVIVAMYIKRYNTDR